MVDLELNNDLLIAIVNIELIKYFESVLPNFDKERVYPSDIRKMMNWYNLLVQEGLTDFVSEEQEQLKTTEEVIIEEK